MAHRLTAPPGACLSGGMVGHRPTLRLLVVGRVGLQTHRLASPHALTDGAYTVGLKTHPTQRDIFWTGPMACVKPVRVKRLTKTIFQAISTTYLWFHA